MDFYRMRRSVDISGVSGVGDVGTVIDSGDGAVLVWNDTKFDGSVAIYRDLNALKQIHGHNDMTELVSFTPDTEMINKLKRKLHDRSLILESIRDYGL